MSDFKTFYYELKTAKLPAERELTFILMADLHNHIYGPDNERLLAAIEAQRPDAILVAGDMLISNTKQSFEPALALFQRLGEKKFPVFYGNGNHEHRLRMHPEIYGGMYQEYTDGLRACGVKILENKRAIFAARDCQVSIYGFDLDLRFYQRMNREHFREQELLDAFGKPDSTKYNILLAHNPVYFEQYADWGADLTLSGHLHGGVIRIPGIGGLITPQARLFPKYDAGLFDRNGKSLIVSRGLGTHTVNVRIFNPAELAVIHLKGKGETSWVSQ